jgi:hypothetical protein
VESVIGMNAEQPIGLRGIRTIMISLQVSANLAEKTSDALNRTGFPGGSRL